MKLHRYRWGFNAYSERLLLSIRLRNGGWWCNGFVSHSRLPL